MARGAGALWRQPVSYQPDSGHGETMKRGSWPLVGLALGAVIGALWGWFGSGGYEAIDSAVGTALICALPGLLIGAVAAAFAGRRDSHRS